MLVDVDKLVTGAMAAGFAPAALAAMAFNPQVASRGKSRMLDSGMPCALPSVVRRTDCGIKAVSATRGRDYVFGRGDKCRFFAILVKVGTRA